MTIGDQRDVIAFLSEGTSYNPPAASVERIDTHASVIFLAGDFAYKIKRHVALGYLDFSSLEKRRAACLREIEINQVTAPGIYLDVVAIAKREDGSLALGEAGDVVEWAVRMRRFDQRQMLDRLARANALDGALMPQLAGHIAAFHAAANVDRHAKGEQLLSDVVTDTVVSFTGASGVIPPEATREYSKQMVAALGQVGRLLDLRARAGNVRRCHGDMHLGNIVLLEGKPTLFDAIEFSETIATVDVLYDLAFLLMDLWHRGLFGHANLVLNRYLERSGEPEQMTGLAALPLFMALRAGVRAMVTIDTLPHRTGEALAAARDEAQRYFELAMTLIEPVQPRLVAVGGLSGTGKTVLSAGLAPLIGQAPGAVHLRSDVERKLMFEVEPTERLGPDAYEPEVSEQVYARLIDKARMALQAGYSVVFDAVSASLQHREMIENLGRHTGVPVQGIWLQAPRERLIERVEGRVGDASDADASVVDQQLAWRTGPIGWSIVNADAEPWRGAARGLQHPRYRRRSSRQTSVLSKCPHIVGGCGGRRADRQRLQTRPPPWRRRPCAFERADQHEGKRGHGDRPTEGLGKSQEIGEQRKWRRRRRTRQRSPMPPAPARAWRG